jgi:pantothenate kinase-related protein Tda10
MMPKASKTFRGQGKLCTGRLTITLSGPQGSGKSLVEKILRAILPLTPVAEVEILKEKT